MTDDAAHLQAIECDHEAMLRAAFEDNPRDLDSLAELVTLLLAHNRHHEAEALARLAVRHSPASADAHGILGRALARDRPHTAAWHLNMSMELSGGARHPGTVAHLATALQDQGDIDGARALFHEVAEALPGNPWALIGLARLEECDRDYATAIALLDRVEGTPLDEDAARAVAAIRADVLARTGHLEEALTILEDLTGPDRDGIAARLSMGRLLGRLGRHDEAFESFSVSKADLRALIGCTYAKAHAQQCAADVRGFFTTANMALLPRAAVRRDCAQPVFIVGFPRSGTTLMEQSLTATANITGGGEVAHMDDMAKRCPGLLGSPLAYPDALSELWMGDKHHEVNMLRDFYLERAKACGAMQAGKSWFTDKNNCNDWHLGLITLAFPASPIIRLVRHPLDVLLSIFSFELDYGFHFGNEMDAAARHYALVADLTDGMLTRFETRCLTVKYEDVVDRQEETMRRVMAHIGEPFDARCLSFQDNKRYGHTESHAQVAEPLYTRARFRYRNYMKHLEPVLPILASTIKRLGYAV